MISKLKYKPIPKEWKCFLTSIFHATGENISSTQALKVFNQLPVDLQNQANQWGLCDEDFRCKSYYYLKKNINKIELW